ncbi:Protein farnesyltransferase subunit beta like [Actinidia chinensis var. chinensis]|uniref:Protein farnesyltransferase subunit beta n=1 Tax=Actinidia chinensis var. chinensis TaxID=1590841 RepID=A0A2R6P9C5_ACTCC|nr:Protein farnesyltransferase subunit beta like [Actinidia chinensis var. chinensis]
MEPSPASRATATQHEQWMVEGQVFEMYKVFMDLPPNSQTAKLEVQREKHIEYLSKGLRQLGPSFVVLDANRPWICYWILHSIALLGESVEAEMEENVIDFLCRCQHPDGGYGGGPGQLPHLATTYAAVNALITLGGPRSFSSIHRGKLYSFLLRMKHASGGFRMHDGGEVDVRACYTAISVASIMNILDYELVQNVGNYIISCQTYEGGIAGEPGSEAHGGYTFCGLATMILINEVNHLDLPSLIDWVVFRQGAEGGFQGRTNKLVDGCYSFWQGGVSALIQRLHSVVDEQLMPSDAEEEDCSTDTRSSSTPVSCEGEQGHVDETCHLSQEGQQIACAPVNFFSIGLDFIREHAKLEPLFHSMALQQYILLCSQVEGGFRDKPGKHKDYYHTCYCLSGLSVCQYSWSKMADSQPLPGMVLGPHSNLLQPIHPLFNVVLERFYEAHEFFSRT